MSKPPMGLMGFLGHLARYLRPYRGTVALIFLGIVVDLVFDTVFRLSFKFLIDDVLAKSDWHLLMVILAALSVGIVISSLVSVGRDYLYARLGTRVLNDLRLRIFERLQRLSVGYYSRNQVGDLMARFTTDLASVGNALVMALPGGVMSLMGVVICIVPLFLLEWRLALIATLAMPLCWIGPRLLESRASQGGYRMKEEEGKIASAVQENISAQTLVKAFGLQESSLADFRARLDRFGAISTRANFLSYLMERTPGIATLVLELLVVAVGALLAFRGHLTIGSLVSFYVLYVSVSQSIYGITWVLPYTVQAAAGMQRIEEILQEEPQVVDAPAASPMPRLSDRIEFKAVTFGYTPDQTNLREVDLSLPHGGFVAFVGPSGSGKSTILNLVMRFYDPDRGAVTFDGTDARSVTQASLRAQMGVVFQENFLFNISIRENILLGRPEATAEEVEAAARAAEIHDFIASLPQGYDTSAGERGGRFSGGQRQRLAIARALLRDPEILVLDEATSALDPATEASVNATLERVGKGRTVLSVTHRLASVTNASRIVVMNGGRVVEQGNHDELLRMDGVYAGLWRKQSGFVVSREGDHAEVGVARLREIPILKDLDEAILSEIAGLFVTERYGEDQTVVSEGDSGDRFFIVVRGKVAVLKADADGKARRMAVLEDGDYFGEIALLRNVPRTATIRTLSPCLLLTLQREPFHVLMSKSDTLRRTMERVLQERLDAQAVAPEQAGRT